MALFGLVAAAAAWGLWVAVGDGASRFVVAVLLVLALVGFVLGGHVFESAGRRDPAKWLGVFAAIVAAPAVFLLLAAVGGE